MFPTGAGLAPKEVIQAKSKQDAHEAVCATRKTSREYAGRRRGASRITAQAVFPVSSLCPVSIPLDHGNQSFFPRRSLVLLLTLLIFAPPRRGSKCCLSPARSSPVSCSSGEQPEVLNSAPASAEAQPQPRALCAGAEQPLLPGLGSV